MPKIFLSHAAFDSDMANYVKKVIETNLENVEVFCSSDPLDLPLGTKWPEEIQKALKESDILFVLATSRSLSQPWVWFETGTFWFTDKKVIPLCIGEIKKDKLPTPLYELVALNLDDAEDLKNLYSNLETSFQIKRNKDINIEEIIDSINSKEKSISNIFLKNREGWIGVEWTGKFLSYDGPIEGFKLIEDGIFEQSMADTLKDAGFSPYLGMPRKLSSHAEKGHRIIYLTDRSSWRQKIMKNNLVLIARLIDS